MKHFLATTAAAALLATTAYAQTAETQSPFVDPTSEAVAGAQTVRASDLVGKAVYVTETDVSGTEIDTDAIEWERVGEVNDLVMSPDGEVNAVLLDIGGFLGIGERSVALSMDQLQLVSGMNDGNDYYVVFNGTQASLENAPEYDATAIGAWAEDSQAEAADAGAVATDPAATETDVAATDMDKSADPAMSNDTAEAADPAMTDTDNAATDPAMADADSTATDPAMTDTDTAATDADNASDPAMTDTDTAATEPAADPAMDTAATDNAMADDNQSVYSAAPPAVTVDGWSQVELSELTTEDLTGAVVFDAQMKDIGEVGELYVSNDGQLTGAELDIGGFLGIGEDHVRVDMESLNIQRDAEAGEVRVYVDLTEEGLKAMKETK
ncbi:PRC-barrel domain-containing protein [Pseudosulfitobacter pseudonitzschiae]|uniref:PRC-barrel domain-containing protein n=1 Tax=Pseudosulfitobacter pseudonitzschiae TaxID=1402135 RepID=UPI001AF9B61D|nr:PRC-barrel domain-containing protein [Pseudosulfitobacter pseudonitzschiae]MBM1816582.1 PRC-barrel domain-containing protein [Pseudosulfitobacter pseudonitzschiae]MBM1833180.1 PRC-barrel domain-containing protein [Pseudosulfitobacter pseudonitzschiae]MBM1838048.1 PRC-barrel domain-containing protein [Pseudosulfitobacter pseudonitzschiae]MBM1843309.1 PRC-barrel domain-containing protein [Pseudosulfitobacter pseudonitzschiae]MBM1848175.1 PRC-barrel domain-containing protein [Pseudosulfitobact